MKFLFYSIFGRGRHIAGSMRSIKPHAKRIDLNVFIVTLTLSLFGLLMVYDSSVAIAIRDFSDQYYFVREQTRWLIFSLFILLFCSRINYHRWFLLALPILVLTLLLLSAVFLPGIGVRALGASRWIHIGPIVLQPAELAKLSLVMYLAAWLSHPEKGRFFSFLLLLCMVFGLIIIEPDLGTATIILLTALTMYLLSGAPFRHLAMLVPLLLAGVVFFAFISPYRFARVTTFLDPQRDPQGASYQIRQVLISLGSGGLFGVGIGKSRQKYQYLPEANTDSIFAIIGEEIGFIGASMVIICYILLIWRSFRIATRSPDRFGTLLAAGIGSWIGIQIIINLGSMVALIPLTGVPLPFISYGGSGLTVTLAGIGILLNISRYQKA